MSSNIPIRRPAPQRSVRNAVKDIENATSRAARIAARTKALAEGDIKPVAPKKALDTTTDSTAGKRKRGVLAEVTGPNISKDTTSGKGREKEKSDALQETSKTMSSTARPLARRPLQTTAGGRLASTAASVPKAAGARRKFTVASTEESSESSAATAVRHPSISERTASTSTSRATSIADDDESSRALKKRHTTPHEDATILAAIVEDEPVHIVEESQVEADDIAVHLEVLEEEQRHEWRDLDAEDGDDPLMVSEYVVEVCAYLRQIEAKTLPDPNYIDVHQGLDWDKRTILLDWMLQVHSMYRSLPETWFLFVNIFDRFLSKRDAVSVTKLQLVGLSCFFVAAKFEESVAPGVDEILKLAGDQYKAAELLKAEQYVLRTLGWDLSYAGPMSFLRRGSKADDLDPVVRTIGKYLLEVASLDWRFVAVPASMQAASALYLARLASGKDDWGPTLRHYAGYGEEEILPVVTALIDHLLLPEERQSSTLIKKYMSKRYARCSYFMREWVLNVFAGDEAVDLETDLPRVKQLARRERRRREAEDAAALRRAEARTAKGVAR